MKAAIIGCGLIGQKRAKTLSLSGCSLTACADIVKERAESLARMNPGTQPVTDWRTVIGKKDVDIVIVATPHNLLAEITLAAVSAGKHVLVEKPAARRAKELEPVIQAARSTEVLVRVGFNHRYHPAVRKAREITESGCLGELMYIRGRYGHGGRIGYEKEWRANPEVSGGGELIDQGTHLIDLSRWFLGEFTEIQGLARTYYWRMPADDNAFMLLRTAKRQTAFLHASCTEWKNLFSLEIFGQKGKLEISGLGGSYGTERLTHYRMSPQMGPPETTVLEYPMQDISWQTEFAEFMEDIRLKRQPAVGLQDARAVLQVVERIYEVSKL